MSKTIVSTAALSVAALSLGLAAPVNAASIGVEDPADTGHGSDLRSVEVRHGEEKVVVVTTHTNLRRSPKSGSGGAVYLDTDPDDKGPEFVFLGGYFEGTDYQLVATEGFGHKQWGEPVDGFYEMTVRYGKERVRMEMPRETLGTPDEVRVSVRVSGTRSDGTSDGLVDWLGDRRSFTEWVASS